MGKIRVRFVLAWQSYRVGDVIYPPGTLREWLLGNGYVTVDEEKPAVGSPEPKRIAVVRPKRIA